MARKSNSNKKISPPQGTGRPSGPTKHISSNTPTTPVSSSKVQIPGFDPEAYGHPGRRGTPKASAVPPRGLPQEQSIRSQVSDNVALQWPGNTGKAAQSISTQPVATGKVSQDDTAQPEAAYTSSSGLGRKQPDAEIHWQPQTLPKDSISSNATGNEPRSEPESGINATATEAISTPRRTQDSEPAQVYETLKKPGESPEETMRRLQVAKQREVMNSIHQSSDKRGQHTANLAELKNLRRPISPEPPAKDSATMPKPASNALLPPPATSSLSLSQACIDAPTPLAVKVPGSVQSVLSSMNPNVSRRPSPLSQYQDASGNVNMKPDVNVQSHWRGPAQVQTEKTSHRNNWATSSEIKAPVWTIDSNAAGSTASEGSGSMCHMGLGSDLGKLIRPRHPDVQEASLVGWDGQFLPPPVDWEQRPCFGNDHEHFKADFRNWLGETLQNTLGADPRPQLQFECAPSEVVSNVSLHPDGLGFVGRNATINASNAKHYGYDFQTDNFQVDVAEIADFEGEWKVDTSIPENLPYRDETANDLIAKKMQLVERDTKRYEAHLEVRKASQEEADALQIPDKPVERPRPQINLYLRPALNSDVPGMTEILNWHILNGVRTSELLPISEEDMRVRMNMSKQCKLPFIVAIERTRKKARQKTARRSRNPNHPIQNTDPDYNGVVKDEHVVGWVSATDWSASDYVECISADLELYVAHNYRQKGIGRCLMDAILDATDRGYMKEGQCEFTVAPEIRHMYTGGGMRDLHKIIFQVRSYNRPLPRDLQVKHDTYVVNGTKVKHTPSGKKGPQGTAGTNAKPNDLEDDYTLWLNKWLESFGFKEEGYLKQIGTKNRRFLDLRYLTRETHWQPNDRQLPDYSQHPI